MYYSAIGLLAVMILMIENWDILLNRSSAFDVPAWKVYRGFLFAVLAYYVTDIAWGILEAQKRQTLLFADTSVYFIAMAAGVLFWTQYIVIYLDEKNRFGRFLVVSGRIFAALVAILVAVNVRIPVLFTVDNMCVYSACAGRYGILVVQILLFVLVSIYALFSFLRHPTEKRRRYRTPALFGLIMAVCLFAQLWFPYLPLYAIAYLLGTCLFRAFVVGDAKEAYKRDLEEATKIAELKQSISSLLDNIPALSFSKDVETGAYLACNQSFAEYAQRLSPEGVVGLTDFDIFDHATAAHFVEDDRKAIEMDKPYVLYEDVADAAGNPRQFQTKKLKFHDANGRLCLLGMSVDVTEMERIRKESEQAKAAYQEVRSQNAVYESMVNALSGDYFELYYVDLETDAYIEYGAKTEAGHRATEKRGADFFHASRKVALQYIYADDRERFIQAMDKEKILREIQQHGTYIIQYRLLIRDVPTYVVLKATCLQGDDRHMIIGVSNVDAQIRDRLAAQRANEDRKMYLRLSALTGNLMVLYIVDPDNGQYTEYNASSYYEGLGIEKQGSDFFGTTDANSSRAVHPEDLERFRSLMTRENVLNTIRRDDVFLMDYRLIAGDMPMYVRLKAAKVEENGKAWLIIGLMDIDEQVRQEQAYQNDLSDARSKATHDALTGVRNMNAFVETEKQLNAQIARHEPVSFAIVVCDINNLKIVNDTKGHKEGDHYICKACATICDVFKHSKVFRVGGDEFAVLCQGRDYDHIEELMDQMHIENTKSNNDGKAQIACGMARFDADMDVETVFERADRRMYAYKARIKE